MHGGRGRFGPTEFSSAPIKLLSVHMVRANCYLDGEILISGPDREVVIAPYCCVSIWWGGHRDEYVCLFNSSIDIS